MALQSICPTVSLPDPKADYRAAQKVEQYKLSRTAFYFPAFPFSRYLPLSAVRRAWVQDSSLPLTCSCGKSLPIAVLRIGYTVGDAVEYQNFTFEKRSEAERVLAMLRQEYPNVPLEPSGKEG